ncbi:YfbK domain-containing protein [Emcibacter sp. SYSU 3D8]|uniref:YfbK domain-containing protein n=1 Tax=Emcibacter sp. SYSU 3D8 TaxID=3133969 RepID=UPI0031FE5F13
MQRLSKARRACQPVAPAAAFRVNPIITPQTDRLRGGTLFSAAATAGAAGSLGNPFGGGFRHGAYLGDFGYERIAALASEGRGADAQGYRVEFVNLVKTAAALDGGVRTSEAPPAD